MNSNATGQDILEVEIQSISAFGIWLLIRGKEYFMSYEKYSWFKDAKVNQILDVTISPTGNLHWPKLDVDLSIDILEAPERFPLIAK